MSDERFDRVMADVLREIAGEEAPMSLRFRLSDITDRAPMGRRLWFATPMRLSMVTAAAVAVLALSIIFLPRETVGPTPSASPSTEPTPTVEPTPAPTVGPTVAPTVEPTPIPTLAPISTQAPVPTAAPLTEWTGLVWSDPVTPSFTVHLNDLLPWRDGYVAVGEVPRQVGQPDWAFLTSSDGTNWAVAQRGMAHYLAALDGDLFAFRQLDMDRLPHDEAGYLIWHSTDGHTWSLIDSPSWREVWAGLWIGPMPHGWDATQHSVQSGLVGVASGPHGIVAIGNSFREGGVTPVIAHSTDGQSWTAAVLPAGSDSALLNAVVEHDGRFVITGATGVGPDQMTARAAAWFSDDGRTWVQASVESAEYAQDAGTEFGPLWAGDDGLLACRGNRGMIAGGWRYMMEWASSDGATWQVAPNIDQSPGCDWSASDGTRIVSLGPRAHANPAEWPGVTGAWTSADGEHWQPLTLSATLTDKLERFWVVPDGVIYAGEQSFWFGTAVGR